MSNEAKASEKKKILTEEFDISMSEKFEGEVAKMCNISEGVLEKSWNNALRVGEERGRKIGEERGEKRRVLNS